MRFTPAFLIELFALSTAELDAIPLRPFQAGADALHDHRALEFGKHAAYSKLAGT